MEIFPPFSTSRKQPLSYLGFFLVFVAAWLYGVLLYATPRENFYPFLLIYVLLFALFFWMIYPVWKSERDARSVKESRTAIFYILAIGIGFRLVASFALPPFSDDYFRFIWDGRLLVEGISPFLQLPSAYMADPVAAAKLGLTQELFDGMNSPEYFTIYPPVLQASFALGASLSPTEIYGSVLLMKLIVFAAECMSLFLILRILTHIGLPRHNLVYYAWNPLVIVELCGNLHFEALMICFLLWAYELLLRNRWWQSAIPFAMAVCSKLLPLMLLPFLLRRLGWKQTFIYGAIVGGITLICFAPILDLDTFRNLQESVKLYFYSFEFNASLWYVIREIGFQIEGYNIIKLAGDYLSKVAAVGILIYTFLETNPRWQNLGKAWLWAFVIYFSLATIVHPWYITTLVALSVFSPFRFPTLWTVLLPLTYYTYRTDAYEENLYLVGIEYVLVFLYMIYEIKQKAETNSLG